MKADRLRRVGQGTPRCNVSASTRCGPVRPAPNRCVLAVFSSVARANEHARILPTHRSRSTPSIPLHAKGPDHNAIRLLECPLPQLRLLSAFLNAPQAPMLFKPPAFQSRRSLEETDFPLTSIREVGARRESIHFIPDFARGKSVRHTFPCPRSGYAWIPPHNGVRLSRLA